MFAMVLVVVLIRLANLMVKVPFAFVMLDTRLFLTTSQLCAKTLMNAMLRCMANMVCAATAQFVLMLLELSLANVHLGLEAIQKGVAQISMNALKLVVAKAPFVQTLLVTTFVSVHPTLKEILTFGASAM